MGKIRMYKMKVKGKIPKNGKKETVERLVRYQSKHRKNSKGNLEDAQKEIRKMGMRDGHKVVEPSETIYVYEKEVHLSEIEISEQFKKTRCNQKKYDYYRNSYLKTGELMSQIIIRPDGVLVDGYISYLLLKELHPEVDCKVTVWVENP